MPRSRKAPFMLWIWPIDLDRVAGRELLLQVGHDLADVARRRCRDRGPATLA